MDKTSFSKFIICGDSIYICVAYYQSSDQSSYVKNSGWLPGNTHNAVYEPEDYPYIAFLVRKNDNEVFASTVNGHFYPYKQKIGIISKMMNALRAMLLTLPSVGFWHADFRKMTSLQAYHSIILLTAMLVSKYGKKIMIP